MALLLLNAIRKDVHFEVQYLKAKYTYRLDGSTMGRLPTIIVQYAEDTNTVQ